MYRMLLLILLSLFLVSCKPSTAVIGDTSKKGDGEGIKTPPIKNPPPPGKKISTPPPPPPTGKKPPSPPPGGNQPNTQSKPGNKPELKTNEPKISESKKIVQPEPELQPNPQSQENIDKAEKLLGDLKSKSKGTKNFKQDLYKLFNQDGLTSFQIQGLVNKGFLHELVDFGINDSNVADIFSRFVMQLLNKTDINSGELIRPNFNQVFNGYTILAKLLDKYGDGSNKNINDLIIKIYFSSVNVRRKEGQVFQPPKIEPRKDTDIVNLQNVICSWFEKDNDRNNAYSILVGYYPDNIKEPEEDIKNLLKACTVNLQKEDSENYKNLVKEYFVGKIDEAALIDNDIDRKKFLDLVIKKSPGLDPLSYCQGKKGNLLNILIGMVGYKQGYTIKFIQEIAKILKEEMNNENEWKNYVDEFVIAYVGIFGGTKDEAETALGY